MASLQYPGLAGASTPFLDELDSPNCPGPNALARVGRTGAASRLLLRYLLQRRREWKQSVFAGALALASISLWLYFLSQVS